LVGHPFLDNILSFKLPNWSWAIDAPNSLAIFIAIGVSTVYIFLPIAVIVPLNLALPCGFNDPGIAF
jgi:hypothetical protein